ncbi:MAG: hypothetical protein A3D67_02295 [Candidatus Lloydbacteria bacterium RIFCSPHIGHO2_02_FULL_51_22]|uniref:Uncharacterized protein n=3 Tax=Candidatus Lloydiibacteriota TaxID=1817910 RepID=A0A1G2DD10_9BACT|nr:MAG: hypothetical protein A3D67_02295 [Candidatus Lloydbacteria bacterium RIFCSPHIGHO2_02_FULL_51_22]OGZ14055.1 MAG: hypothetical protein A3J08_03975 [Candidatus Lloydbacteria bacterium RIFCSPLOWO2_02_FULL_51_11]OGZ17287.1 MAG: hypothetical protein A3G11_01800 [Candidatus Lloydbacteria bacterium RIFCSPLOWO2_12_FULL_51_9]
MDKLLNRNVAIFAVLALVVLGGYFLMNGDASAPAADTSMEATDQAAAADTAAPVDVLPADGAEVVE